MPTTLERAAFSIDRAVEYFEARELQAQTGQPRERFLDVLLKELCDNGLDASESRGVPPEVIIEVTEDESTQLVVMDNALDMGLQTETFTRKKALPTGLELTELEREHFVGERKTSKSWVAQRVELNALSAPDLVSFIERKLQVSSVRGKVIPPDYVLEGLSKSNLSNIVKSTLERMLQQMVAVNELAEQIVKQIQGDVPLQNARHWVEEGLAASPCSSWSAVLSGKISTLVCELEIDPLVRQTMLKHLDGLSVDRE